MAIVKMAEVSGQSLDYARPFDSSSSRKWLAVASHNFHTSADVYQGFLETGVVNESTLADLNIPVGATPEVVFPSDPHLQNPYSHHFSLGLEQELTPDSMQGLQSWMQQHGHRLAG